MVRAFLIKYAEIGIKGKTVMYLKMHWFVVCVSVWTAVWVNLW